MKKTGKYWEERGQIGGGQGVLKCLSLKTLNFEGAIE